MSTKLYLLILEDNIYDVELEIAILSEFGYLCQWDRVETEIEFTTCLNTFPTRYNLILADYNLPTFDGLQALKLCQQHNIDIPFILVSGQLGEEIAIESLKAGATDYVLKSKLSRLAHVVQRALREKEEQIQRKQAEIALHKVNRAYKVLSQCNKAVIQATEQVTLLQQVCNIIVEVGGYMLAWVGFVEHNKAQSVRPVAYAGYNAGYLDNLKITWADTEQGQGPTGIAIRTKTPCINKDTDTNPNFTMWRTEAKKRGYSASIALPLIIYNQTFGALNVYSNDNDAFDIEEVNLLMELASNLAYGIITLQIQAKRLEAESALATTSRQLRTVFDNLDDVIWSLDVTTGQLLQISSACKKVFGYSTQAFFDNPSLWQEVIHPDDMAKVEKERANLRLGQPMQSEYRIIHPNNEIKWIRNHTKPTLDAADNLIRLDGIVSDVTLYQLALQQLRLQVVALESAANAIIITNQQGIVEWANPALTKLTGYPLKDVIDNTPRLFKSGKHSKQFYQELWDTILSGNVWQGEIINRHKNGNLYTEEVTITPVKDHHEQISHFVAIKQDITHRKQAEAEIKELNEQLEQRVAARTQELTALYEVTAIGSQALDLQTMLNQSLAHTIETINGNAAMIHLLDNNASTLKLKTQIGIDPANLSNIETILIDYGLANTVLKQDDPLLLATIYQYVSNASSLNMVLDDIESYIGVSICVGGQAVGVFSVFGGQNQQFNVEEVALFDSIADQIGVMVESDRLRQMAAQMAITEERGRLARDLHDSVTQLLYSLTLLAASGQRQAKSGRLENVAGYLSDLGDIAQQALREMRLLIHQLRPPVLEQQGLVTALQQRLDAVEGRTNLKARLLIEKYTTLPTAIEEAFYRITQEALNNALKHADATTVTVKLCVDNNLAKLDINDDGLGFDFITAKDKGGMGLTIMQERAEKIGATFTILSQPSQGTHIKLRLKIKN